MGGGPIGGKRKAGKSMDWTQVSIATTSEGVEAVTGRLYLLGVTGTEIEDGPEMEQFLQENTRYWDYVDDAVRRKLSGGTRVKFYIGATPEGNELLAAARASMRELRAMDPAGRYGRLEVRLSGVSEEDWANGWKKYFKPLAVGEKVLICPAWETVPPEAAGRTVFSVDPGMTFGTGTHESTRLCIRAEEECLRPGADVLDIGCGSGILSIIALELGAGSALALDIDPNSRHIAHQNAALNGVDDSRYTVLSGDILADSGLRERVQAKRYGLVLANIVADVILALAPMVPGLLTPDGTFVCSGIIDERGDEVAQGLARCGLTVQERRQENGWVCLTAGR